MGTRQRAHARDEQTKTTHAMRWTIGAVAVVVVVGLGWSIWLTQADSDTPTDAGGASDTITTAGEHAAATPTPDPTPVDGSEVLPPAEGQTIRGRLPDLPQPTPLVAAPLPETSTASGSLVEGYPDTIAGPTPAADVLDSSIATEGATMQVALTARTDETPEDVAEHYRALWSELGLAPSADTADTVAFTGPFASMTLATTTGGTGTRYTIYATLRTE